MPRKKIPDTSESIDSGWRLLSMNERKNIRKYHGKVIRIISPWQEGEREGVLHYTEVMDGRFGISGVSSYPGMGINTVALIHDDDYKVYIPI